MKTLKVVASPTVKFIDILPSLINYISGHRLELVDTINDTKAYQLSFLVKPKQVLWSEVGNADSAKKSTPTSRTYKCERATDLVLEGSSTYVEYFYFDFADSSDIEYAFNKVFKSGDYDTDNKARSNYTKAIEAFKDAEQEALEYNYALENPDSIDASVIASNKPTAIPYIVKTLGSLGYVFVDPERETYRQVLWNKSVYFSDDDSRCTIALPVPFVNESSKGFTAYLSKLSKILGATFSNKDKTVTIKDTELKYSFVYVKNSVPQLHITETL